VQCINLLANFRKKFSSHVNIHFNLEDGGSTLLPNVGAIKIYCREYVKTQNTTTIWRLNFKSQVYLRIYVVTSSTEHINLIDSPWNIVGLETFQNSGFTKCVTFAKHNRFLIDFKLIFAPHNRFFIDFRLIFAQHNRFHINFKLICVKQNRFLIDLKLIFSQHNRYFYWFQANICLSHSLSQKHKHTSFANKGEKM
jgi:hypothetical protein